MACGPWIMIQSAASPRCCPPFVSPERTRINLCRNVRKAFLLFESCLTAHQLHLQRQDTVERHLGSRWHCAALAARLPFGTRLCRMLLHSSCSCMIRAAHLNCHLQVASPFQLLVLTAPAPLLCQCDRWCACRNGQQATPSGRTAAIAPAALPGRCLQRCHSLRRGCLLYCSLRIQQDSSTKSGCSFQQGCAVHERRAPFAEASQPSQKPVHCMR